jgi:class 3 adenylate cyclase/tetratricopeptide (TPR) repeat protein
MVEIKAWLEGLALAEYEPAFREHQITVDVLGDLSDDDLRSIGIAAVGARKRLLRAIVALQADAQETGPAQAGVPPAAAAAHVPAERRHLTVMFVDMVGFTPLSTELDPEELGTVIGGFHLVVSAQVAAFGGFTARSFGDGLLVYFGYPQAHEDDAERAVRAALASIEALRSVTGPGARPLEARIGIASGWVVLGDLAGTAQHDAVGQTPNLAARLQNLAHPGSVVVSQQTAQLLSNAFELIDLGDQALKGFRTDQRAYLVSSARVSARFEAKAERGLTALVGREADLGMLLDRWSRVQRGEGQVVLITGEPGIGKSRTVHSLQVSLRPTHHKALRWQCSPFHVSSALHPVIGELEAAAGFLCDEDGGSRLAKLQRLSPEKYVGDADTLIQLLAELLSVPGAVVPDLPPEEKKVRLFFGLTDWLRSLAGARPTLLVVEDAHWIDPTTAELLDRMVEALVGLPAMVLVTARPEYRPPAAWLRLDRFSHHHLERLDCRQVAELVEKVAGTVLPHELTEQIIAKTDGVPLFVEELTKAVLESGVTGKQQGQSVPAGPPPELAVPATLQDSLTARLDRLSSAKSIAQIGSALGRDFSHALIEAVADIDASVLAEALGKLQSAGLLFQREGGTERVYTFKHALVRDAAYDSLLRSHRAVLHGRIAATIEARFPTMAETQPELIARHLTEAGRVQSAVNWWRKAGQRALSRLSFQEAIAHFDHALGLAPSLQPGEDRDRLLAALWLECAAALRQTQWGGRRMEQAARSALAIGISLNDLTIVGHSLTALAEVAAVRPDFAMFREANRDFLRLELCISEGLHTRFMVSGGRDTRLLRNEIDPTVLQLLAAVDQVAKDDDDALIQLAEDALERSARRNKFHSARASTIWQFIGLEMFWCGRFAAIDQILQRAIASAKPDDPTYVGWHQHLLAKTWLAFSYAQLGFLDKGRELAKKCIVESDQVGELSHLVLALNAHNVFCFYCDDAGAVRDCAIRLEELSFRYSVAWYQPAALLTHAWANARINPDDSVREAWLRGRDMLGCGIFEQIHVGVPHLLVLSAHAANALGMPQEALADIDRALTMIEATGEAHSESELYRARGEILLGTGDRAGGERSFRRALDVGRRQSARGLELRAAISLGRLLDGQRRTDEARDILAPIYARFTEGFAAPIMLQARALLDKFDRTAGYREPITRQSRAARPLTYS